MKEGKGIKQKAIDIYVYVYIYMFIYIYKTHRPVVWRQLEAKGGGVDGGQRWGNGADRDCAWGDGHMMSCEDVVLLSHMVRTRMVFQTNATPVNSGKRRNAHMKQ